MATTHVFIVDTNTFRYHLEYMFVGTGVREEMIDFNNRGSTSLNPNKENNLVSMIADSVRVRENDFVLFYLQQNLKNSVLDGKFYGVFQIKENNSFLDNNDGKQYLKEKLRKSLIFRTLIKPFHVYPEGVTEWDALDEIKRLQSPFQMLWSLIYRKLKGNRGNCMITIYESERLIRLIEAKNKRTPLQGKCFTFNAGEQRIEPSLQSFDYQGRKESINILPRLLNKYNKGRSFEVHLQAYILQNIGRGKNRSLDHVLIGNSKIEWIGNEVSCGVGMQKIDILLSLVDDQRICMPIELKSCNAKIDENIRQIKRYVDWLKQYYLPNIKSKIAPVLIVKKKSYYDTEFWTSISEFNQNNADCLSIKLVEYEVVNDNLRFSIREKN